MSHEHCAKVQDAYSLRAVPQVHGASRDAVRHVGEVLRIEMGSVTDNPLVFPEEGRVISGGNFHGQPLALAADYAGIAAAELADISERRIEQMLNPALSGLPAFLAEQGGLHSGLMISQYTAASLVSENKVLAHPASVDSIPTSANQEDHVSMGTIACRKARQIYENVLWVLAIEVVSAAQALDFHKPLHPGKGVEAVYEAVREAVPHLSTRPVPEARGVQGARDDPQRRARPRRRIGLRPPPLGVRSQHRLPHRSAMGATVSTFRLSRSKRIV